MLFMNDNGTTTNNNLVDLVSSYLGPVTPAETPPATETTYAASNGEDENVYVLPPGVITSDVTQTSMQIYTKPEMPSARVVIFSKDRPWQLKQLLQSLLIWEGSCNRKPTSSSIIRTLDICIIFRASTPSFVEGYNNLMGEYKQSVLFLIENDQCEEKSFASLLQLALKIEKDGTNYHCDDDGIVMFLTDDCLLLEPLENILVCAAGALMLNPLVFNFITRLHLGITWSQTRAVASLPPWNMIQYHPLSAYNLKNVSTKEGDGDEDVDHHEGVYLYERDDCSVEWAYPFDLSGGVYRHGDVQTLLSQLDANQRRHPNILELTVNQLIGANNSSTIDILQRPLSAIPTHPMLVVLAINRVQDEFHTPLALPRIERSTHSDTSHIKETTINPSDPMSLLDLLDSDCQLDIDRYKSTIYNSSHIGDFFLTSKMGKTIGRIAHSPSSSIPPKISILIPVHKGPPDAASHCISSIIMQPLEEYFEFCSKWEGDKSFIQGTYQNVALLTPMQIVLVDDRCDDGSIDAVIQSCQRVLIQYVKDMSFMINDYRCDGVVTPNQLNIGPNRSVSVRLDILQSPGTGVACALNHGLKYCDADLVARMDADDICAPKRLSTQVAFMNANPMYSVVGTTSLLFSTKSPKCCTFATPPYSKLTNSVEPCYVLRPSISISDPGFLAWSMFFSCTISHPTVLYRKGTVQKLAGYDESIYHCEDYDLWLRVLNQSCRSMVSLPYLGLWHRKHEKSNSSTHLWRQKSEADEACRQAMEQLFHGVDDCAPLDIEIVRTLRNPSSAKSCSSLDSAAELLVRLESSFLNINSEYITQQEISMINSDCSARIGEMATILVTNFGLNSTEEGKDVTGSVAWKLWSDRCPLDHLERMCLLCQSKSATLQSRRQNS